MLRQLRFCRIDPVSIFGSGPSIIERHFLRACSSSHRSVLSDSPAAAAKDQRWVMLNLHGRRMDDSFVADAKTVADSRTRFPGHQHLRVSLGGAAPPASSFLYYNLTTDSAPGEDEDEDDDYDDISVDVVTAHTDSVLLQMGKSAAFADSDFFVYRAGATGPPSLSLLPDREILTKTESVFAHRPSLDSRSTGLLRRGENDVLVVVVQLDLWYNRDVRQEMVEFCVLRPCTGMRQWELMEPVPILLDDATVLPGWRPSCDDVIHVGDRYLCWVDYEYENGFFLCDMADDARPQARYLPLPTERSDRRSYNESAGDVFRIKYSKKMGSAGASKVRFVSIDPHCCCGCPGRSTCAHSFFAFTVTTWTMDLESTLTWVKDGEIDCEDVWGLPGYQGLPRASLECPVVSLDNPNVICFLVSNRHHSTSYEDQKIWMIQIDMKTKTLLSVVQFNGDRWRAFDHLPAQLQY